MDIGIPPLDVLKIATRHSAEFLQKQGELGTIEGPGKIADLLILSRSLQDIANSRSIETVIQNGEVDASFHPSYQNPIPRPLGPVLHGFPLPVVDTIEPTQAAEGAADLTLSVRGKGFVRASTAQFGGVERLHRVRRAERASPAYPCAPAGNGWDLLHHSQQSATS